MAKRGIPDPKTANFAEWQEAVTNAINGRINRLVAYSVVGGGGGSGTDTTTIVNLIDTNAYVTVQDEGTPLTQRNILNFIGDTVTAADDAGNTRTNVTITGYDTVADEGTPLTKRRTLNFIGAGVTAVDNAGNTRTDVTIAGGGDNVSVNGVACSDVDLDDATPAPPTTLTGFTQSDYYFNVKWQKDSSGPDNVSACVPKRSDVVDINGMMLGNYIQTASIASTDNVHPFAGGYHGGGTKGDTFPAPTRMWLRNLNAMTKVDQTNGRTMTFRVYRETEGTDPAVSIHGNAAAGLHTGNAEAAIVEKGETWSIGVRQVGSVGGQFIYNVVWEAATIDGTSLIGNGCSGPQTVPTQVRATNTAQAGGASTITLDAGASVNDDQYNGNRIWLTGGTGSGQDRVISDYVGATKVATVEAAWSVTPDATTTFVISGTEYPQPGTAAFLAASQEVNAQVKVPFACTLRSLFFRTLTSQGANGDLVLTVRKNGADTSCRITVPASNGAGLYANITNTVSLAAGDLLSFCVDNNHSNVSCQLAGIVACLLQTSLSSDKSNFKQMLVAGADDVILAGATHWYPSLFSFETTLDAAVADVRSVQVPVTRNGVFRNLYARLGRTTGGNPVSTVTVTLYKNNVATSLVATSPGTLTIDWVSDTTHEVSVVKGDLVHLAIAATGAGGSRYDSSVIEFALS